MKLLGVIRNVAPSAVISPLALCGCSEEYKPAHEVLRDRFENGATVDLGRFVPGNWSAICVHGQYETITGGLGLPADRQMACTGDDVPFESDAQRITYVTQDNRCFTIAIPKYQPQLATRTACIKREEGFNFRLEDSPGGRIVKHIPNDQK